MNDIKIYNLSDFELLQIARLCYQEQGSLKGVKAEASLAANILETNSFYNKTFGENIYGFMRNSGWFAKAEHYMDNGEAAKEIVEAVKDVLVNGHRTLPLSINEHDCFNDIVLVHNNGFVFDKTDRSKYKSGVTRIINRWKSRYTFWGFPDKNSDPFGYTEWIDDEEQRKEDDTVVFVKVGD